MIKIRMSLIGAVWLVAMILSVEPTRAVAAHGGLYAYPRAGQTQEQQAQDQVECSQWAVQQTGVAPTALSHPGTSSHTNSGGFLNLGDGGIFRGGGLLGDAATGAGLGAIGGAVAGNTGVGAGIGALAGALLGEVERSNSRNRQGNQQQQAQYHHEQTQRYKRAFSACMSARNYSVT